jgi:hypothetical protein
MADRYRAATPGLQASLTIADIVIVSQCYRHRPSRLSDRVSQPDLRTSRPSISGTRSPLVEVPNRVMGPFVRSLYVRLPLTGRQRRRNMGSCLDQMTVSSLLGKAFVGDPFPGHDRRQ